MSFHAILYSWYSKFLQFHQSIQSNPNAMASKNTEPEILWRPLQRQGKVAMDEYRQHINEKFILAKIGKVSFKGIWYTFVSYTSETQSHRDRCEPWSKPPDLSHFS